MATTLPPSERGTESDTRVLEAPPATATAGGESVPRLAAGIELIGRFEDSGFKEPPFIARRADGQVVQMAPMLFALAEEVDGRRALEEIAEAFSRRIERGVTAEMVEQLIDEQLRPLGIVAPEGGGEADLKKVDPLLALKFRTKVVPQPAVAALTRVFSPLFHAPVVVIVAACFLALDVWLFGVHGISQSLRHVIYQPALLFMLVGGVALATAFHEIGHATACRFGGAKPGVMGVGVYIVWPAFYTDITDAYRLGKRGRLRTDLGGMYFNAIFGLAAGGAYALTGFEPLLLLVLLQTFAIVQQSLPLLRLDGYYVISDLTGVPDILLRMRSILTSVLPWRKADEKVNELKPWVRAVVTGYVLTVVPIIAFMFLMMLVHAPRVFATGWDSFWLHWDRVGPAFDAGRTPSALMQLFQMLVLALPAAGIIYTTSRVGHRVGGAGWRWSAGSAPRRGALLATGAAAIAATAFLWWPHGEYKPIQPGERGTLAGAVRSIGAIPTGRPSLTPQREQQLGGAPTERQLEREGRARPLSGDATAPAGKRRADGAPRDPAGGGGGGTSTDSTEPSDPSADAQGSPGAGDMQTQPAPSTTQPQDTTTQPQDSTQTQTTPDGTTTQPQTTTTPSDSGGTTTTTTPTP